MAESSPDQVVIVLNSALQKLYEWCSHNCLIPHCSKTQCMILMCGQFVGPLQAVSLGNGVGNQVKSARCLGSPLDSKLNWNIHVNYLIKSPQVFYFLPTTARVDFYFKIILPSVTYGLVIWGSCRKSFFVVLEKIHECAAKTIQNLD